MENDKLQENLEYLKIKTGKDKFIDKKKALTFKLVYRSEDDPNYDPNNTQERVFKLVENKKNKNEDYLAYKDWVLNQFGDKLQGKFDQKKIELKKQLEIYEQIKHRDDLWISHLTKMKIDKLIKEEEEEAKKQKQLEKEQQKRYEDNDEEQEIEEFEEIEEVEEDEENMPYNEDEEDILEKKIEEQKINLKVQKKTNVPSDNKAEDEIDYNNYELSKNIKTKRYDEHGLPTDEGYDYGQHYANNSSGGELIFKATVERIQPVKPDIDLKLDKMNEEQKDLYDCLQTENFEEVGYLDLEDDFIAMAAGEDEELIRKKDDEKNEIFANLPQAKEEIKQQQTSQKKNQETLQFNEIKNKIQQQIKQIEIKEQMDKQKQQKSVTFKDEEEQKANQNNLFQNLPDDQENIFQEKMAEFNNKLEKNLGVTLNLDDEEFDDEEFLDEENIQQREKHQGFDMVDDENEELQEIQERKQIHDEEVDDEKFQNEYQKFENEEEEEVEQNEKIDYDAFQSIINEHYGNIKKKVELQTKAQIKLEHSYTTNKEEQEKLDELSENEEENGEAKLSKKDHIRQLKNKKNKEYEEYEEQQLQKNIKIEERKKKYKEDFFGKQELSKLAFKDDIAAQQVIQQSSEDEDERNFEQYSSKKFANLIHESKKVQLEMEVSKKRANQKVNEEDTQHLNIISNKKKKNNNNKEEVSQTNKGNEAKEQQGTDEEEMNEEEDEENKDKIPVQEYFQKRSKNETKEEKKLRKEKVKEFKALRKQKKQEFKQQFEKEKKSKLKQVSKNQQDKLCIYKI